MQDSYEASPMLLTFSNGGGYVNNSFQLDALSESYPQEIDFVGLCFSPCVLSVVEKKKGKYYV